MKLYLLACLFIKYAAHMNLLSNFYTLNKKYPTTDHFLPKGSFPNLTHGNSVITSMLFGRGRGGGGVNPLHMKSHWESGDQVYDCINIEIKLKS